MAKMSPVLLQSLNADQEASVEQLPGTDMEAMLAQLPSGIKQIIDFLVAHPLYVQPVANWIRAKEAAIARHSLHELYSPEDLEALMDRQGLSEDEKGSVR